MVEHHDILTLTHRSFEIVKTAIDICGVRVDYAANLLIYCRDEGVQNPGRERRRHPPVPSRLEHETFVGQYGQAVDAWERLRS